MIINVGASAGTVGYSANDFWSSDGCFCFSHNEQLNQRYLYYSLQNIETFIKSKVRKAGIPTLDNKVLENIKIPLPPLSVQHKIVEILDKFTALEAELEANLEAELDCRKRQYEYYRNQLLSFDILNSGGQKLNDVTILQRMLNEGTVEWKSLGEVCDYEQPSKYLVSSTMYNDSYPIPVLTAGKSFILGYTNENFGIYKASEHQTIIFDDFTRDIKWVDFDFKAKSSAMKMITSKDENIALLKFIYYWLCTLPQETNIGNHKRNWISKYTKILFPLPPLSVQCEIVEILDKFDTLCNSISEGLPKEIELRRKQYEYYRNQLLTFAQ